jgi:IPT/TIG domain
MLEVKKLRRAALATAFLLAFGLHSMEAQSSSALPLTTVANVTPLEGPVGTNVTILGNGFGASQGSSTVSFNGVLATPTAWSNTEIRVPVPAGATTGPIKICVAGKCVSAGKFTVTPTITSVDPPEGAIGTEVMILGRTFGPTQGSSTVTFNGVLATPTSWSATKITVPVPAGATSGPLVVTVGGWPSNGINFIVTGDSADTR